MWGANRGRSGPGQRRRRGLTFGLVAFAALVGLGLFFWAPIHGYARLGAAYGARIACSCRYVGGRGLDDCRKDFEPGMALISLSEDTAAKSVTARAPLFPGQTATFREGQGCVLEPWDG